VVGLSPNALSLVYALGAVLLGLWLFFRHPSFGPRTLKAAFLLVACAYGFLFVTGPATAAAEALAGPTVALLCTYLPILTLVFWSALHLLRVTIATVGRSSP
jgi:hypothetical protein